MRRGLHLSPRAGRGRREASGEGASPHNVRCDLPQEPLTPTLSPQRAGRGRRGAECAAMSYAMALPLHWADLDLPLAASLAAAARAEPRRWREPSALSGRFLRGLPRRDVFRPDFRQRMPGSRSGARLSTTSSAAITPDPGPERSSPPGCTVRFRPAADEPPQCVLGPSVHKLSPRDPVCGAPWMTAKLRKRHFFAGRSLHTEEVVGSIPASPAHLLPTMSENRHPIGSAPRLKPLGVESCQSKWF